MKRSLSRLTMAITALTLAACATPQQSSQGFEVRSGVIEQITPAQLHSDAHTGVSAVVGGIAGGALGSLIGAGTGRDVAMVLGAVGGAIGGAELDKKYEKPIPGQQVIVRVKNGVLVAVTQPVNASLHTGQAVYIEGSGNSARVVPR